MSYLSAVFDSVDTACAAAIVPLAVWILVSGIDDAVIDALWIFTRRQHRRHQDGSIPEKLTAIFVPLWNEHAVIRQMVEHNLAAIAYRNFHFFIGAYPNDALTIDVVRELEREHGRVHLALCPHDGPTSKADCLNWIYQRLLLLEEDRGVRFEVIVIHDAEDLIHSQALGAINRALDSHDTVQLPVFALPTQLSAATHGVYCDEFAEYQTRDMPVRQWMGAFLPSCGVGAGYRREALERLAAADSNRIFDPGCLTEDYENGLRLHQLGCAQAFLEPESAKSGPVATREYFPRTFASAVRQRSRWLIGNVLQNWERHAWQGTSLQRYWFWRDRKGLAGSLITALTNALTAYMIMRAVFGHSEVSSGLPFRSLAPLVAALLTWRIGLRAWFTSRLYGWRFALAVPLRLLHANAINAVAAVNAIATYAGAKWRREPLRWVKTEHAYPNLQTLREHKRDLVEVLTSSTSLSLEQLAAAINEAPADRVLGDYLVMSGYISEDELTHALSVRENLPVADIASAASTPAANRCLPAHAVRRWKVVPFHIGDGVIHVAGSEAPSDEMHADLRRFTGLKLRYHLATRTGLSAALERLLPAADKPRETPYRIRGIPLKTAVAKERS